MKLGPRVLAANAVTVAACLVLWARTNPAVTIVAAAALVVAGAVWATVSASSATRRSVELVVDRERGLSDARARAIGREVEVRAQILDAMTEAVVLIDGGVVAFANRAAHDLLGAEAGRLPPPQIAAADDGPFEFEAHHPTYREVRGVRSQLPARRALIVARDVTEAKRLDRIRHDFVANASHELKTPVAAILATSETLRNAIEEDPEAARAFVENLVKESDRLARLIAELLDLARLDQPQDQAHPTDVSAVVREVVADMEPSARDVGLALETRVSGGLRVLGRPQDLSLLARNLLDNAIAYTPRGGRIVVALDSDGPDAVLTVADTGIGIPSKDIPRIFERFYRVDRARSRETGGTGLGLSIVRHIVESHGGRVEAQSELGAGTTFTVRLPLA